MISHFRKKKYNNFRFLTLDTNYKRNYCQIHNQRLDKLVFVRKKIGLNMSYYVLEISISAQEHDINEECNYAQHNYKIFNNLITYI